MKENNKFLVIVNPNAGKKQGKKDWPQIASLFKEKGIEFDVQFTQYSRQATKITQKLIEEKSYTKLIAIGGDGTINEVVNGVFLQNKFPTNKITVGAITIGTGNDWAKMFDIPLDYSSAIECISKSKTFLQDVGKVYYYIGNKQESRFFINAAGLGFDAMVTKNTNISKSKGKSNTFSYLSNMIKSLYRYKPMHVKVCTSQRDLHEGQLFTLSLGIGRYTGGGMQQTPKAISDDGLFDLMLVDKIAKTKIIRKVNKLFNGKITDLKEVQYLQTDNLKVQSDSKLMIEIDGENIGHGPFEFELVHKSLNIYIP